MQGQLCSSLPPQPSALGDTLLDPLMMLETLSCPSSALSDSIASTTSLRPPLDSEPKKTPVTQSRSAASFPSPSTSQPTPIPTRSSSSSCHSTPPPSTSKQRPATPDSTVNISVYALPLFKEASGETRYAFIPVRDPDTLDNPQPTIATADPQTPYHLQPPATTPYPTPPATTGGLSGFFMQRMEHASAATRSTWDSWGRMDKRTWLRWLHDMGQNITEDVSPEARLARGISAKASRVTVFHPACLPRDHVHRQITSIVSSRSRSELWRMIGFMAFLPVGVVLDHTVFLAVPGPLTSGYSSYKSYIYYKGTRGSMRMQQLIHGYEQQQQQQQQQQQGAGASQVRQVSGAASVGEQAGDRVAQDGKGHPLGGGRQRSVNFGGRSSGSGMWQDMQGPASESVVCTVSDGDGRMEAARVAPRARSACGAMELAATSPADGGGGGDALRRMERSGSGREQEQEHSGAGRSRGWRSAEGSGVFTLDDVDAAQHQQQQQQEEGVPVQSSSGQQGLAYSVLPGLASFVELLHEAPGDVLPEEAAQQLVLLLPPAHRQEVARHIAELRRRHARLKRQPAAPRHAEQELVDRNAASA